MKRIVNLAPIGIATAIIVLVLIFVDYRLISSNAKKSSSLLKNSSKPSSPSVHNKITILISKIDAMSKKLDSLSKSVDEFISSDKKDYFDDSSSYESNTSEPRSYRNRRGSSHRNYPPLNNINDNLYFRNIQKKLYKENPFSNSFDKRFTQQKNLKPGVDGENKPETDEKIKVSKQLIDKKQLQNPLSSTKQSKVEDISFNKLIVEPEFRKSQKKINPLQTTKVDSQSPLGIGLEDKDNGDILQFKKKLLKDKDIDDKLKNNDEKPALKIIPSSGKGDIIQTTDKIVKTNFYSPGKASISDEKNNFHEEMKLSKDPIFFSPISNNSNNGPFDAITDLTDFSFGPVIKSLENSKQKNVKLGEDLDTEKSPLEELTKSLFTKTVSEIKSPQQQKTAKNKEKTENNRLKSSSSTPSTKNDKQESSTRRNSKIPMERTSDDNDRKENEPTDVLIAKEVTAEKLKAQVDRDRKIEEEHLKKEKIKEDKKSKRKGKDVDLVMSKTTVSLDHSHDKEGNISGIIVKKDIVTEGKLPIQKEPKGTKKDKKGDTFEEGEKVTKKDVLKVEVPQEFTAEDKAKSDEETLEEILSKPFGANKELTDYLKMEKDLEEAPKKKTLLPLGKKSELK